MFNLNKQFILKYKDIKPKFGFNGVGEFVYQRTYSRLKQNGKKEQWFETVERVVNGIYTMQKEHINTNLLGWNDKMGQESAQEMYDKIFNFKFLPPGRGLWALGTKIINERKLYAALNNCAFISTKDIDTTYSKPFRFLMDASMLGVGVGFDFKGAGKLLIKQPLSGISYKIEDSREGFVDSTSLLLDSFFKGTDMLIFDYTSIRPNGELIKTFGGVASGYEPLKLLHTEIIELLNKCIGKFISITNICDIMNLIGKCVISGNVRRTAEIAFGDSKNKEFLNLKNYKLNPERIEYGWTSNNSIFADIGMDYTDICERIKDNGEPGIAWLENMQKYSRLNGNELDNKDYKAMGGNPCLEQTLESNEICCLVETFPYNHESLSEFKRTLKFAYLYAKTVTLGQTHWPDTNRVVLRNRRIGCSMTGIQQFIYKYNLNTLKEFCEEGYKEIQKYDKIYSDWFCIPKSIKTTSIKPSGTVSLLAGATPGMHFPQSKYYIRRTTLSKTSELVDVLKKGGYHIEDAIYDTSSVVVSMPVYIGDDLRTVYDVSMWEQLEIAAFLQRYWADNQVSCTVTFNPKTEANQIKYALNHFQYKLKGISFLPLLEQGAYRQMPYETITKDKFEEISKNIVPIQYENIINDINIIPDKFCDSDKCIFKS